MTSTDWLNKRIILIMGKGGVGKTMLAHASARHLASQGKRTLLIHVLQVVEEEQKLEKKAPNLWEITLRASDCFQEYIMLKLKIKALYTAFLGNKVTQYLEKAAPGVREMVLLGKIWFERENYDHVVVDMPSTGYALTMIHTPFNFASLFPGGPIYHDSQAMIETFSDPKQTAFVTVSLGEEMPIQESIELAANLKGLMPANPSWLVMNRLTRVDDDAAKLYDSKWAALAKEERSSPLWRALDHTVTRARKQADLLRQLRLEWAPYTGQWLELPDVPLKSDEQREKAIADLLRKAAAGAPTSLSMGDAHAR